MSYSHRSLLRRSRKGPRSGSISHLAWHAFLHRAELALRPRYEAAAATQLHGNADRNAHARIPSVEQVVAVVDVFNIDFVGVIPVSGPVPWPGINHAEPEAIVLEAWISAHHQEGEASDAELVITAEVSTKLLLGDPVAVIPAALAPGAMVALPVSGPMLLPSDLFHTLLFLGAWL